MRAGRIILVGLLSATLLGAAACGQGHAGPTGEDAAVEASSDAGAEAGSVDGGPDGEGGTPPQALVWVFSNYSSSLAQITLNPSSFTIVSPEIYDVDYKYTSGVAEFSSPGHLDYFDGLTSKEMVQLVHGAGKKCLAMVTGGAIAAGTDLGIRAILDDSPGGAQASFIASMVTEAKSQGYDGYNLDWEVDSNQTTYAAYGKKWESFLAAFRDALHAAGLTLTIEIGSWMTLQSNCSGGVGMQDLTKMGPLVDLAILEDYGNTMGAASTACPSSLPAPVPCSHDFALLLDLMCVYMPIGVVGIAAKSDVDAGNNAIAGQAISMLEAYGVRNVAVWPGYNNDGPNGTYVFLNPKGIQPTTATWYDLFKSFLASF